MKTLNRLKILLVDDNPGFLEVTASFLSSHPHIDVVGLAQSGQGALEIAAKTSPHLVVLDLVMPVMNGLETTRRLKAMPAPPYIIIVTLYEGAEFSSLAHEAGADNFITKSDFGETFLPLVFKMFPHLPAGAVHECQEISSPPF